MDHDETFVSDGFQTTYDLYCDPEDPSSLVMLKNVDFLSYFGKPKSNVGSTNKDFNIFPNYYILNKLKVSHKQKAIFHCMLKHSTCPEIMVAQFCRLARTYYGDEDPKIQ